MQQYTVVIKDESEQIICPKNVSKIITEYFDLIYYFSDRENNIISISVFQYGLAHANCLLLSDNMINNKRCTELLDISRSLIVAGRNECSYQLTSRFEERNKNFPSIANAKKVLKHNGVKQIANYSDVVFVYDKN